MPAASPAAQGRLKLEGESLRQRTARGAVINGAYLVGFYSLSLLRGFAVAAFLSLSEFGAWGVLAIALGTMLALKQVGIGDKYIQQSDDDQERAFARAFTLELMASAAAAGLLVIAVPVLALLYGRPEFLAPGLVLALAPLGSALQAPVWIHYRRMDFVRQRRLQAVDPIVGFVVTIALAVAGAGYWSLIAGTVVGAWAGGLIALRTSPYPLRLTYDRGTLGSYASFSWPLLVATLTPMVMAQTAALAGTRAIGLAGVGVIVLAGSIADYTNRVDAIVTETLYPVICAVRDRTDLLLEAFVKSNRLALMWGVPFGLGLVLFGPDLVEFVLGARWRPGVHLIEAFGAIAAANHIGFNWDAFFRARGDTRPVAVWSVVTLAGFLACALPLLILDGLDGFAAGMAAVTVVSLLVRSVYLRRLLPALRLWHHTARAVAPSVPAAGVVVLARLGESGSRTPAEAILELLGYLAMTVLVTAVAERSLLVEVVGYLRSRPTPATRAAAAPGL